MNGLSPSVEKELLIELSTGDRKAFDWIYHAYKVQIYNKLLKLLRSDELAEELLQEVFFKLWVKRHQLADVQSFSAYLYRMAANLVADFYRKAALDQRLQDQLIYSMTELYNPVEEGLNYKESNVILQSAIAALPPQRQAIFNLCKVEGKSYQEVSELLGISTSTINDHIVKATRHIKKHFTSSQEVFVVILTAYLLRY